MNGKTHSTVGAAVGLSAALIIQEHADFEIVAQAAALGGLAGLVPDWLQINLPWVSQVKGLLGHRGFSHWAWTAFAVAFLARPFVGDALAAAILAGWLSHVLLDALAGGVPAFWPLDRLTLAHVKTGGEIDELTGGAGLVVLTAIIAAWSLAGA